MQETLIVGAGIGGLTLALELERRGIPCRMFESAPEIKASGSASTCCHTPPRCWRARPGAGARESGGRNAEAAFYNRFSQPHL
jgi:cation diffusion facilitator CzcD-associated flavoprotein CzcO